MLALEIVKYAYLATLVCILIVEIVPSWRIARPAALAAIFLVTVGGSAWAYAAYYTPGTWPEFEYDRQAKADDAGGRGTGRGGRAEGGDGDPDGAGEAASAGSGADGYGDGDASGAGAARGSVQQRVAAVGTAAGAAAERTARHVAEALGLAALPDPKPAAGDLIKDCTDCPDMVLVPPGEARIGANDDDRHATVAERPARTVKVWPGFVMTRAIISQDDIARFRNELRRASPACAAQSAAVDANAGAAPAVCLSVEDAEAFALWLSNRTGKRYRLPSAVEWEFAMRTLPPETFKRGEAAEIVDDCWQDRLPRAGFEILASHGKTAECERRVLMGATATEDLRWQRLSVRRPIEAKTARPGLGFRLVRDTGP